MKFSSKFVVICSMFILAACDSDNDFTPAVVPDTPPAATLKVQVLHGSPDAPAVNVLVDGGEVLMFETYENITSSNHLIKHSNFHTCNVSIFQTFDL